jgi:hypothetical protein
VFYGAAYFLKLLPFDGSIFIFSILVGVHYLPDVRVLLKANSGTDPPHGQRPP